MCGDKGCFLRNIRGTDLICHIHAVHDHVLLTGFIVFNTHSQLINVASHAVMYRLGDALSTFESENVEASCEQISEICDVFKTRELTLLKMLEMYEKMYDDVQNEETKKVNLVKSAFDNNMAMIKDSDMETQDKFAALGYVTDKIAELVEKIVVNK